ncbi:hypothetical protein DAI22_08g076900 [Oryza sativa Japonica Group]|nr:uncharacterized protein LOC9270781 isoform X1 [Oryza sativa Japonica Group]KAF2918718.1 hypothetical protein DAI22_08g076900 [Oryza sativa Japonica Group]
MYSRPSRPRSPRLCLARGGDGGGSAMYRQQRKCDATPAAGVQCRRRFPSSRLSSPDDQVVRFCRRCAVDLGLPSSNLQGHFYLPAKDTVQMCSSIPLLPQKHNTIPSIGRWVDMYHVFLYGLEKACFSHDDVQGEQGRQ